MRWNRWRKRAREQNHENNRRFTARSLRARPAELLYRPRGASAEPATADARPRPVHQRRDTAAHGACCLLALAARPCPHRVDLDRGCEESARRRRRRHRRGTRQSHDAVGRRADPSQGHQVSAAIAHRGRPRLLAGRSGLRRGRAHARAGRGRLRTDRHCL